MILHQASFTVLKSESKKEITGLPILFMGEKISSGNKHNRENVTFLYHDCISYSRLLPH